MFASLDAATLSALFALGWLAACISAMCVAHVCVRNGPRGVMLASVGYSTFIAGVFGTFAVIHPGGGGLVIWLALVGIGFATGVLVGQFCVVRWTPRFRAAVAEASTVAAFAAKHFSKLDSDGDGVVIRGNVLDALDSGLWCQDSQRMLNHIREHWEHVGHEIGTATHYMANTSGTMPAVTPVYGISREDLLTYPDRLRERLAGWL